MTSQTKGRLVLGIQVVFAAVVLGITYHEYRPRKILAVALGIGFVLVAMRLKSSKTQGKTSADENLQKAGLTPDRDEAQPARKAIDNRSMEI